MAVYGHIRNSVSAQVPRVESLKVLLPSASVMTVLGPWDAAHGEANSIRDLGSARPVGGVADERRIPASSVVGGPQRTESTPRAPSASLVLRLLGSRPRREWFQKSDGIVRTLTVHGS